MLSRSVIAASVLAAVASAQSTNSSSAAASSTVSQSMPAIATASFNGALVNQTVASSWCHAQQITCPQICGGAASNNQCSPTAFTYTCVCSNGTVPDVTAFIYTLPYFICQATYGQCVDAHPNDLQGQTTCKNDEKCGTRNATAEYAASQSSAAATTSSASATSSGASASGGSGSSTASSSAATSKSAGNAALVNTQQVATGAFAALLMAAVKLLL